VCLLFNVKELKNIGEKEIREFKKNHSQNGSKKWDSDQ
jgi:hypothetical protein